MKKILLVTSPKTLIDTEEGILNRTDLKIFTTTSGKEALSIHRDKKVDLIIIELDMPEMNGDTLCSIIRKDDELKKVSLIIICNTDISDIKRYSKCSANSYITRPINPVILMEKVGQLINIAERKSYRAILNASVNGTLMNKSFICYSRDISSSGILIETDKVLAVGDTLLCSFYLRNSIIINEGKVVRSAKKEIESNINQYGIKFSHLTRNSKSAIEVYIEEKSRNK
jgi:DNA-binding response OmpR family regulator